MRLSLEDAESSTGHHCPVSGWWVAVGGMGPPRFIAEGELMPTENGTRLIWEMIAVGVASGQLSRTGR
jgi:hypothetical protein